MDCLAKGPFPDWIAEEPDKQLGSIGEAWGEAEGITREISPRLGEQELRALRAVFYAGARGALEALPESRSHDHFETQMAERCETSRAIACRPSCVR